MYSEFPYLAKNLRRGNTLISFKNEDGSVDQESYHMGRKGFIKFHNFEAKFDGDVSKLGSNIDLSQPEKDILLKSFEEGKSIEMFSTLKADGENV